MLWRASLYKAYNFDDPCFRLANVAPGDCYEIVAFETKPFKEGEMFDTDPLMTGPAAISFVQSVMDEGYKYGLRPSKVESDKDVRAHLSDMRDIAYHLLKMR